MGRKRALARRKRATVGGLGHCGATAREQAAGICGDWLGDGPQSRADTSIIGHYLAKGEHSESGDSRTLGRPGEPASWRAVGRAGSVLSAVGVGAVFG